MSSRASVAVVWVRARTRKLVHLAPGQMVLRVGADQPALTLIVHPFTATEPRVSTIQQGTYYKATPRGCWSDKCRGDCSNVRPATALQYLFVSGVGTSRVLAAPRLSGLEAAILPSKSPPPTLTTYYLSRLLLCSPYNQLQSCRSYAHWGWLTKPRCCFHQHTEACTQRMFQVLSFRGGCRRAQGVFSVKLARRRIHQR